MNPNILEITKQRFDQETNQLQHLDSKASNLIGYSSIIVAFIGFLYSVGITEEINKELLLVGVVLFLLSILSAFVILIPLKKTRPVFKVEQFFDRFENKEEIKQNDEILNTLLVLISNTEARNNFKSWSLYIGNILLAVGIVISFISLFSKISLKR